MQIEHHSGMIEMTDLCRNQHIVDAGKSAIFSFFVHLEKCERKQQFVFLRRESTFG